MLSKLRPPLEFQFNLREWEKIKGDGVRWVGKVGDYCRLRRSQKLLHNEWRVSRSVVMMQGPGIVAPLVWMSAPVFSQSPRIVAIEFSIRHLSWWNKFLMNDAFDVKLLPHFRSRFRSKVISRTLIIDWHTPVLETLKPFVGLRLA